ncbi:CybS-domain-containing protein [Viridothelium virens]|uniref:Succinate dehydrogenase [ubiquinone] cytochrome b small subunit n=1 Tax=Viridothelium virens TaxID=1048519 RepID=A0A6A6H4J3_VIRVR|nr:CybS-domain-containing protein [Viridothelium virens]
MASIIRPSLLRHCRAIPTERLLSTNASTFSRAAFRSARPMSSSFPSKRPIQSALPNVHLRGSIRVAAFHASGRREILPPLPQKIQGTANDPAPVPDPSAAHGSYHWSFERLISAALIPLTIAPFAGGSLHPLMDGLFCAALVVHSHIGFESIIIDYLPQKRVPRTRALFMWGLRLGTIVVLIGLYEFETNDVGLTEAIKRIWHA